MKNLIYIILLVFSSLTYGETVLKICATSQTENKKLKKTLNFLRIESDNLVFLNNCWFIKTNAQRVSLYETFVAKNHPQTIITSEQNETKTCLIKIEESENLNRKQFSTHNLSLSVNKKNHNTHSNSQIRVAANKEVEFRVESVIFKITCTPKNNENISLKASIQALSGNLKTNLDIKEETKTFLAQINKNHDKTNVYFDLSQINHRYIQNETIKQIYITISVMP